MTAQRPPAYHVGMTPESVIDEALKLTNEKGLFSWSVRDLAKRLGVSVSVIYHHVGGKDVICRFITERVIMKLDFANPNLHWKEWFRATLYPARSVLTQYPGVAKWLTMHGPIFPTITPIIDQGMATLIRAGFGAQSTLIYATLFNTAMTTITLGDERQIHEEDGPRDTDTMFAAFAELESNSTGIRMLKKDLLAPFTKTQEEQEFFRENYYRFVLESLMAGIEQTAQPR